MDCKRSVNFNGNANEATNSTDNRKSQGTRNIVFPRASSDEAKNAIRGFVVGSDGKVKIAPWPGAIKQDCTLISTTGPSSSDKKLRRKHIPLEPLNLQKLIPVLAPRSQDKITTRSIPKPKPVVSTRISPCDIQVRKELFKVPQKKRLSFGTKAKPMPKKPKVLATRRHVNLSGSPLLDIDEAAAALRDLRVMETPQILVNQHETPPTVASLDPKITESVRKFAELEKACATPMPNSSRADKDVTPPTVARFNPEITNSAKEFAELETTCATLMPTSVGPAKDSKISAIKALLEDNQAQLNSFKQIVENLQESCRNLDENQKMLVEMLTQLEVDDEDKENVNFKPTNTISKNNKQDLRKFALRKNFAGIESESPRTKKAVDLYNTVRKDCGVLCTPKLDRNSIDTPQCSAKKSLSRKIQKQCLLLQDTPRL